jgi:multidrug efflux pump
LLQPRGAKKDLLGRGLDRTLGWFFRLFNWGFRRTTGVYTRVVGLALRGSGVALVLYGGLLGLTWWTSTRLPTGYIPVQDLGKLYVTVQLPDAASLERTEKVIDRVTRVLHETPGVAHTISIAGQSFTLQANGSNFGNLFVTLDDFDNRRDPSLSSDAIAARLRQRLSEQIPEAVLSVFGPPPVAGLGSQGGFKVVIEDRSDNGLEELEKRTRRFIAASQPDPEERATLAEGAPAMQVANLFTVFRAHTPQLYVDLDRDQCQTMGVDPGEVFNTLQVFLGSLYVNDFNKFGRTWQVVVQARGEFRNDPAKVQLLQVKNARGEMVPLGAVLTVHPVGGPILLTRYNMFPAVAVVGRTRPGVSSGQGIAAVEQLCDQTLPASMAYEWTEINYIQIDAAHNLWNNLIFPLAVAFVFLVLAAQYESWALPLAVILVVPLCILSSLLGVAVTGTDVNIFTQIGFVVLVGLASKNAILIVEFAKRKRAAGLSRTEATLAACRLRLRPILMTSFAFILGVVPLLLSTGAGHEMRRTLGTAVFSGMLGVTLFGIFLTPVFFFVIEGFLDTPLFSSVRARLAGRVLRTALVAGTLGLLGLPALLVRGLQRPFRAPAAGGGKPEGKPG